MARRASPGRIRFLLVFLASMEILACTHMARITNREEPSCQASARGAFAAILAEEGEKPDVAACQAAEATTQLAAVDIGPRPFVLSSPSGVDYAFFFAADDADCVVRLYGTQEGFVSYTNSLTYIASRALPGCSCAE